MELRDELIKFETSKKLKSLGFNIKCAYHWSTHDSLGEFNMTLSKEDYIPRCYNPYNFGYLTNRDEELYSAPTQSLLQRWLRKVHNIEIISYPVVIGKYSFKIYKLDGTIKILYFNGGEVIGNRYNDNSYNTYEESLEKGLQKALELF